MLALGIHFGQDASVSVCSPEGILFALQDERVSRIKHHCGFPRTRFTSDVILPEHRTAWLVPADDGRTPVVTLVDRII